MKNAVRRIKIVKAGDVVFFVLTYAFLLLCLPITVLMILVLLKPVSLDIRLPAFALGVSGFTLFPGVWRFERGQRRVQQFWFSRIYIGKYTDALRFLRGGRVFFSILDIFNESACDPISDSEPSKSQKAEFSAWLDSLIGAA
jgi:hypothetical protein